MTRDKKKATEEKLREIYTGSECVLECVELLKELAEEVAQVDEILLRREEEAKERFNKQSEKMGLEKEVEIFQGEPLVVKKSKFIAHCAIVNSVGLLPNFSIFLFFISPDPISSFQRRSTTSKIASLNPKNTKTPHTTSSPIAFRIMR